MTESTNRKFSLPMSDKLRKFSGHVFHVVRDNNLLRYRVDDSGRLMREKVAQAHRGLRKAVTGNPDKKIRDYMTEIPQVKLIDKVSFTFGVTSIVVTEFLALRHPSFFTQWYYLLMSFLITNRYFQYVEEKMDFFMLDFCYFMNLSVAIQIGVFPDCLIWYKANYVLCMGCLMMAIIVWQNSLVFHSLDKLTSFFLHAFPPLTLHLYRWQLIPSEAIKLDDSLSWKELLFWPMVLYSIWQVLFFLCTDVFFVETLRKDPERHTSVRYLVRDKKNGMNRLVTKVCRATGILKKDEPFDGDAMKTKLVFMLSQLIYTFFTFVFTPFLYTNYTFSFIYIVSIYMWCIWRGGTYYIEVFSERYKLKFLKADEDTVDHSREEEALEDSELFTQIVNALSQADSVDHSPTTPTTPISFPTTPATPANSARSSIDLNTLPSSVSLSGGSGFVEMKVTSHSSSMKTSHTQIIREEVRTSSGTTTSSSSRVIQSSSSSGTLHQREKGDENESGSSTSSCSCGDEEYEKCDIEVEDEEEIPVKTTIL